VITVTNKGEYTCYKAQLGDATSRVRIHFHTPSSLRDPLLRQIAVEAVGVGQVFVANEIGAGQEMECDRSF